VLHLAASCFLISLQYKKLHAENCKHVACPRQEPGLLEVASKGIEEPCCFPEPYTCFPIQFFLSVISLLVEMLHTKFLHLLLS